MDGGTASNMVEGMLGARFGVLHVRRYDLFRGVGLGFLATALLGGCGSAPQLVASCPRIPNPVLLGPVARVGGVPEERPRVAHSLRAATFRMAEAYEWEDSGDDYYALSREQSGWTQCTTELYSEMLRDRYEPLLASDAVRLSGLELGQREVRNYGSRTEAVWISPIEPFYFFHAAASDEADPRAAPAAELAASSSPTLEPTSAGPREEP